VPLKGLVDIGKEVERLRKEEQKVDQELARVKKLLSNRNFADKAPPEAVEKEKTREIELNEKKKIISERLRDLSA
jgi:valyl-tRNA synthetase